MLTDLSWLKEGEPFPPRAEASRITAYGRYKKLFESKHAEVYEEALKRIQRVIGNFENVVSYPIVANYQKLISLKTSDLLIGEPPQFKGGNQQAVDKVVMESDLINLIGLTAIDVSRYGDGIMTVTRDPYGTPVVEITSPAVWYPIVSPTNVKRVTQHVLAWVNGAEDGLLVQVHERGRYEVREYQYRNGFIGKFLRSQWVTTGLDSFAVLQVPNAITSDRSTGISDYEDIDSIVSEIMVRIGQISRILDKHADPSMQGPPSALERDPFTGQWKVKAGSFFMVESKEDAGVSYVTWDGQLDANFKQLERLLNMLYTVSEMGSAIFGDLGDTKVGAAPSGTALRRLMIAPLAKVARVRNKMDDAIKEAFRLCGLLGGVDMTDVSITWQDGLPGDPVEEATIMKSRTKDGQTMSVKRALMQYDAMSEEDAEDEIAQIEAENAAASPMTPYGGYDATADEDRDLEDNTNGEDEGGPA